MSDVHRGEQPYAEQLHAWLYDAGGVGWPGELELYRSLARHWSIDRDRRDAIETWRWERLGRGDRILERVTLAPLRLHLFEIDEVRRAATAAVLPSESVYGAFDRSPLTLTSPSMLWLMRRA